MTLPPPAAALARIAPRGTRVGLAPGDDHLPGALHVLVGDAVTRCGHRATAAWSAYDLDEAPALRLCRRCLAGLPKDHRAQLAATRAELRAVYEHEARWYAVRLARLLAALREAALVDGAAYERTAIVEAQPVGHEVAARWAPFRDAPRVPRAERDARVGGHVATAREVTLVELLDLLDPTRVGPGRRVWLDPASAPAPGTPVDVGGTYDPRAWMGRKR